MVKNSQKCSYLEKISRNVQKFTKTIPEMSKSPQKKLQKCQKVHKITEMSKNSHKNSKHVQKFPEMFINVKKVLKCQEISKKNPQEFLKMCLHNIWMATYSS